MVRRAVSRDCLGMGSVYCRSWQKAYEGIVPQDFLDHLTPEGSAPSAERIASGNSLVFEENGLIIGLVNFGISRTPISKNFGELRSIYILPEHWHRGIGSQLFLEAKEALKNAGFDGFYLWVLRDNLRARRFYEKMAMTSTNEEKIDRIGGKELVEVKYEYVF